MPAPFTKALLLLGSTNCAAAVLGDEHAASRLAEQRGLHSAAELLLLLREAR